MKNHFHYPLILILSSILFFSCTSPSISTADEETPPNIVLIISDDHSWPDYSFMDHPNIQTPNIDRLASESLTFTRGYVSAPLCSPSLASMITGLFPHQHGITGNDPAFDFEDRKYGSEWRGQRDSLYQPYIQQLKQHPMLPQLLSQKGYVSHQSGKWWGGNWKNAGFTAGMTHGDWEQGGRHGDEGLKVGREGMKPVFDFMTKAKQEDKPFFVWYAPFLPHTPHNPPDSLLQKYLAKASHEGIAKYWAMIDWLDITVGQIDDYLDNNDLTKNTIVIYICDNGWITNVNRKKGEPMYAPRTKQSPYEMGLRTPIMFKWPEHIAAKMDTATFVSSIDLVPTILETIGLNRTEQMRGVNLLDEKELKARTNLYAEDFSHDMKDVNRPAKTLEHQIIFQPPYKLIQPFAPNMPDAQAELYHMFNDPHEKQNLATSKPDITKQLRESLKSYSSFINN